MQDIFGSVRRSLVFKPNQSNESKMGGFVEKMGSSIIRKSRIGIFGKVGTKTISEKKEEGPVAIRWRKGELIGCGAFGRVYMGMNLDSGELIAVKQVSIAVNSASKEKTQAHIKELEEEVNLLKNLSHPNIVRYLGTAREDDSLNILLEFVPGGSISSLLGKFGSFPESVIRMYTKQLLLGLEYLHKHGIMHRDIKGANILVDNKGCIKLADFGASKKVVELATMTGAKSMKGTPYWMAPEVILQTGHNSSADIWSVGCTVIEMATGKPPWSQQYQEVAALFHIGTTKSHPPIPEHLSVEAVDFLLKCLQKEPSSRAAASDLLRHPFVTWEYRDTCVVPASAVENPGSRTSTLNMNVKNPMSYRPRKDVDNSVRCSTVYPEKFSEDRPRKNVDNSVRCSTVYPEKFSEDRPRKNVDNSVRCSTVYPEKFSEGGEFWVPRDCDDDGMCRLDDDDVCRLDDDDMCRLDDDDMCRLDNDDMCRIDDDDFMIGAQAKPVTLLNSDDLNKSFNPMSESTYDLKRSRTNIFPSLDTDRAVANTIASGNEEDYFTFPGGPSVTEDDDEVTESKIRAFLDEKALDLKKLQTPLYEEFFNSLNTVDSPNAMGIENKENLRNNCNLPPKSKSPKQAPTRRLSAAINLAYNTISGSHSRRASNIGVVRDQTVMEVQSPKLGELKESVNSPKDRISPSFYERQRIWEEELYQELERKREMMRQAGVAKTSSPNRNGNRQKDKSRLSLAAK